MQNKEIRDDLLKKAIHSEYMREFYKSINREFTDFELAAMLWNSRMKTPEKLAALKDLSEITEDEKTKEQIESRLRYEDENYHFFADNADGKCIYTVLFDDRWPSGCFKNLDMAVKYGSQGENGNFTIRKYLVVEDTLPKQKVGEWNPNLFPELKDIYEEYSGQAEGSADYSADGKLLRCGNNCLPDAVKKLIDGGWSTKRFENYPLFLETPFDKGDIVMDDDHIGIIDITKEEWEESEERLKAAEYADYYDATSTIVQCIGKDGRIHHDHPSLVNLKKAEKEMVHSDVWEYAEMVSAVIRGEYCLDFFLIQYEDRIKERDNSII